MLSTAGEGGGGGGGGGGEEPGSGGHKAGHRAAPGREERQRGAGVQEGSDGSRYEGEAEDGLKHGRGRWTWRSGEYHEGSYYKDYRHGDGQYCWPTGHKFIGKFYLNRKEGYGRQLFPDGATFQGLYHTDRRFGPGVVSYSDGRQDVGLWVGPRLLRLCSALEEGFSLKNCPEYAADMDPAAATDSLTQPPVLCASQTRADRELLPDENFIYPPGLESYSTNGDFLPLPAGRRRELDRHFYGELWEPDIYPHQGYERDPLSKWPLQARMQAHIHKHRRLAENVCWDVAAVLSLSRGGFGPKGPLEEASEQLIRSASRGERRAVSQILRTGLVYPDVADSQGNTALMAATINNHHDVIHLLLDEGVDIDKLNCDGMSALAVCHVLYFPLHCLNTSVLESPQTQVLKNPSSCGSRSQISQADFTTDTLELHNRPQTSNTSLSLLSDRTAEEPTDRIPLHSSNASNDSELIPECRPGLNQPETPTDTEVPLEEDSRETETEGDERKECSHMEEDGESKEDEGKTEEKEVKGQERVVGLKEEIEEGGEERHFHKEDEEVGEWRECRAETAADVQDGELTHEQTSVSACSVSSSTLQDTQETAHKMAAMKLERDVRLDTLKLLLERGSDPNASKVPMPVLFLAIMAADSEAVRRLLLCGARTDIPLPPERKGLYPLHVAAALPGTAGPTITELLLCAVSDPDAQACDQDDVYKPDKPFKTAQETLSTDEWPHLRGGGRTALHVACQRVSDYQNASEVVKLLLSHRASTRLLWSGHSPLSLAIASGNDQAVEELLRGGADPNIPLSRGVGSALCAVANINYHLCGNRPKLLDVLAEAGADILMPVMVGDVVGTAVDFAHDSFNQDLHIANTPFHALNLRERETFIARRQLLSMMGDLLRQTAVQREKETLQRETQLPPNGPGSISSNGPLLRCGALPHIIEKHRKPLLKFCYHCGRSVSVKLTACSRCHKVSYCSMGCKLKGWEERHKDECVRATASAIGTKRKDLLKPPKVPGPLSDRLRSPGVHRPLIMTEKILESQVNLKENYSCN
ncbi:ankyrin repeat and MYND domain-containing protein 1 [Paralichthys olivaceus]|uniref:ankyrin repeat and MYND domain-containing protein 1 n=1 Tax=Paralichthys olivaceus TaxID=8255 RepID=UPI003752FF51